LIAGRKLLLADDSAAVQKVVELTFADEGMEVFSVGDGQSALDKLEHLTPDVVLADAFMPGLNGYELCRSMKGDQRFAQIPVMLLISSFAPFDEAEAQRAGADDIITKPFQSIRQLVSRVDSLLSDRRPKVDSSISPTVEEEEELTQSEPDETPIPVMVERDEPHVTVLVEAAQMETALPHEETGGAGAPDIEFQTADTARLEPEVSDFRAIENEDTLEIKPPLDDMRMDAQFIEQTPPEIKSDTFMNETVSINEPARPRFNDALLDLDESDFAASNITDDVVLDLDPEAPSSLADGSWDLRSTQEPVEPEPVEVEQHAVAEAQAGSPELSDAPAGVSETHLSAAEDAATGPLAFPPGTGSSQTELSPEAINAIARRVIEQMSDQVVREIAWEVVPELSELMIRKKLDQK
jgi:CheY-like chemotaxis protein